MKIKRIVLSVFSVGWSACHQTSRHSCNVEYGSTAGPLHRDTTPGKSRSFRDLARLPNGATGVVWLLPAL